MRLIGYVDGVEVRFDFTPPNIFKAIVPKKVSGVYLLELHAINDSGSQTNFTDIFVYINFQSMEIKVVGDDIIFLSNSKNFQFSLIDSKFNTKEVYPDYDVKEKCFNYAIRERDTYTFRELVS